MGKIQLQLLSHKLTYCSCWHAKLTYCWNLLCCYYKLLMLDKKIGLHDWLTNPFAYMRTFCTAWQKFVCEHVCVICPLAVSHWQSFSFVQFFLIKSCDMSFGCGFTMVKIWVLYIFLLKSCTVLIVRFFICSLEVYWEYHSLYFHMIIQMQR